MTTDTLTQALDAIRHQRAEARAIDCAIAAEVVVARANGASWQQIGDALGTTRQNAQKRYGPTAPIWT